MAVGEEGAGGGGAWQLTAEVKPQAATATPPPEREHDGSEVVPPPWQSAAEGVRTSVKWMVTAFAAVGAVMFAKGFVATPKLSWESDKEQLIWAWVVGGLGLFGLGVLIYLATNLLRPSLFEIADLPGDYKKHVNANAPFYLPSDAQDLDAFVEKLSSLRAAAAESAQELDRLEEELANAEQEANPDPAKVAAARDALARHAYAHDAFDYALGIYTRTRQDLLDRAGYWHSSKGFNKTRFWMVVAAIVAALGGIGYQLLLAAPDEPESDGDPSSPPSIGVLIRSDTAAGRMLWKQLRLARCQADEAVASIPVVVASGKGSDSHPYVVSTLATRTCDAATFTVIDDVARVEVKTPKKIVYEELEDDDGEGD